MNKMMQQAPADAGADGEGAGGAGERDRRGDRRAAGWSRSSATGAGEIIEITIDPKAIDPDDPELLADIVLAAVNEALRSAQASSSRSSARRWAGSASACPGM